MIRAIFSKREDTTTIFLLFLTLCLFHVSLAYGQDSKSCYDITGHVRDINNGEALPNANIVIRGTKYGASTNLDGFFCIVDAPAELCTLDVSYIGYYPKAIPLDNVSSSSMPVNINLFPSVLSSEEVVYYGEKYEIWKKAEDVSQMTVSAQQIARLPSLGESDIFRAMQLLPGVSGSNDQTAGMYVRGGTPDQNLILFDGMKIYHVDHFFGMFSAFNTDAVKDIQMYKGGYPARYGGRLSSVVDLTGKSGSTTEPMFGFGINLLSLNAIYETPVNDRGSLLLSFRRSHVDLISNGFYTNIFDTVTGYDEPDPPSGIGGAGRGGGKSEQEEIRPNFYFYDINTKFSYSLTNRDFLAFSLYSGHDDMDNTQELTGMKMRGLEDDVNGVRTTNELSDWGNLGGSIKWSRQWNSRMNSNLLASYSTYTSNYERNAGFTLSASQDSISVFSGRGSYASEESNEINDFTLKMDNEWHFRRNHTFNFGSEFSNISTNYTATVNDSISTLNIQEPSLQLAGYAEDKWLLSDPLELTLGLRGVYYDRTDNFYFEPRSAFQYKLTDRLSFNGTWGLFHQFIHQVTNENVLEGSKDFWLVADENLAPSSSEHRSIGLAYETRQYLFDIQVYQKLNNNLVEFSRRFESTADYNNLFFFGSGIAKGIEFLVQKKVGMLTGWVSYTLGDVEHEFPGLCDNPFPAEHDRTHEFKIVSNYTYGLWNLSASWIFASGRAYTAPESQYSIEMLNGEEYSYIHVGDKNSSRLPDYHRLDLSASRVFESFDGHAIEVGLSIFNVYNHDNVAYREYDLDTVPIVVTDVLSVGFMPSIFFKYRY